MEKIKNAVAYDATRYSDSKVEDFVGGAKTTAILTIDESYKIGDMVDIPSPKLAAKFYPAFEIWGKKTKNATKFEVLIGYLSATRIASPKFIEVALSSNNNIYAKKVNQNRFNAPVGTTFGLNSLKSTLENKVVKCKDIFENLQPAFSHKLTEEDLGVTSENLIQTKIKTEISVLNILELD